MSLDKYQQKRDFARTNEPPPGSASDSESRFVIQKHRASNLHYDFRLEHPDEETGEIILKSWAVPKNLPREKKERHLAIPTEDHPVNYIDFEGEIPEGNYGAGTVTIWDRGTWEKEGGSLAEGKMVFQLEGEKIKGTYVLVETAYGSKEEGKKNWLIFKKE